MREFKDSFGYVYDLDDPKTYEYLPDDVNKLDDLMFKEIGMAVVYTTYFHPNWDKAQVDRINVLIKDFADNRKFNYNNRLWFKEKVFLFKDETENMC